MRMPIKMNRALCTITDCVLYVDDNLGVRDRPVLSVSLALSNAVQHVPPAFHFLECLEDYFFIVYF